MELGMHQHTSMRLEQKLAPQMIQSISLLQANTLELEQMIQQEMLMNPLLEIEEEYEVVQEEISPEDAEQESTHSDDDFEEDRDVDMDTSYSDEATPEDMNWDSELKDNVDLTHAEHQDLAQPDLNDQLERSPTYSTTLEDHLLTQLHDRHLPPAVDEVVRYLIECLDDDGYLRTQMSDQASELPPLPEQPELAEAEKVIRQELLLEEASQTVREAFHALQMLDPPGIGARNLQECLVLQAWRSEYISDEALEILEKHFHLFVELEYALIGKAMSLSADEVKRLVIEEISHLSLRPGSLAGNEMIPTKAPELLVEENEEGELEIRLNDGSIPRLKISETYLRMLKEKLVGTKERKYIRDKMKQADLLIKSIGQRKTTMIRVMSAILKRQRAFFEQGPGHLKPMILQDIAEEIGMHISTVNRVTNGKYVQTPWGVLEIKQFFSSGVVQQDGSEASAEKVKDAIKRVVEQEDRKKPYSDDKIVKLLEEQGIKVARRTVTKYREHMGILPSRVRKKLA